MYWLSEYKLFILPYTPYSKQLIIIMYLLKIIHFGKLYDTFVYFTVVEHVYIKL